MEKVNYCECLDSLLPVRDALDLISGKWKIQVIISIGVGNHRFSEIQRSIPTITPKVLAKELKDLEQHRLIKREILNSYPVTIQYTLEPYADTLTPIIQSLKEWGKSHRKKLFALT
ncbi:winged helix-turn-helix transcriptional regulator [Runella sp.]|uniref:winged helix-turn-helix transcriptional regulator n=1 Tax=Runella sp. TaxID=1960881 RepID=UPI003D0B37C5